MGRIAKGLDVDGMPLADQRKLEGELRKRKYQVNILTKDGRKRFLYLDDPQVADVYCKQSGAKILKTLKL